MKRFFILCTLFISLIQTSVYAQAQMPYYRQFFFNPYMFNPAYVAINDETEINLSYRQQWIDFKDAPVTISANAQFPTSGRVALGLSVSSDKQVLLRNNNFMGTFGYIVPISENQSLRFALSAGIGQNKLDLTAEELNTNDPTIINASSNNFYVDGNFGVVYTHSGLRLGFALTDIFESNSFNEDNFNEFELSNLKNRIYSVSYKFDLGHFGNFALEPYFLYRQSKDGLQDAWEAASVLYYKDKFWTGGSYNQHNGVALFLGMNLKETIKFSYSYEFPPFSSGFTSNSSHELHVGIRLGKKKTNTPLKKSKTNYNSSIHTERYISPDEQVDVPDQQSQPEEQVVVPAEIVHSVNNAEQPMKGGRPPRKVAGNNGPDLSEEMKLVETDKAVDSPKEQPSAAPSKGASPKPFESFTMTKGHHYVIVGVFSIMDNSLKFSKEMMDKGYMVNVGLNPHNNLYYVYLSSSLDKEEVQRQRNEYKTKNLLKEAWVFTME